MTSSVCDLCGGQTVPVTREIKSQQIEGHTFVAKVPATQCTRCGEGFLDAGVLSRFELRVAHILAEAGLRTGSVFRFMRKVAGLGKGEMAELLDLSPEIVTRWETENQRVGRGAFATLAAIIRDQLEHRTDTIDRLRALGQPKQLDPMVRIELAA